MKLPVEILSLPPHVRGYVEAMPREALSKDKSYTHPKIKAVHRTLMDRFRDGTKRKTLLKEWDQIEKLNRLLNERLLDTKAQGYEIAARLLQYTRRAYNLLFSDIGKGMGNTRAAVLADKLRDGEAVQVLNMNGAPFTVVSTNKKAPRIQFGFIPEGKKRPVKAHRNMFMNRDALIHWLQDLQEL